MSSSEAAVEVVGMHRDTVQKGASILLMSGSVLYFDSPDPKVMDPEVIAHALSQLCRWTGQTLKFFSVAQHCVIVSKIVPPEHALAGLLHDASEAFIGDVSRPLKYALNEAAPGMLSDIEDRLHAAIAKRYGFPFPYDPSVKLADNVSLATEKRDILPNDRKPMIGLPEPLEAPLKTLGPKAAKRQWLERFEELGGKL